MDLSLKALFPLMKATSQSCLPLGGRWLYEPAWEGCRMLLVRTGGEIQLFPKAGRGIARNFPDVTEAAQELPGGDFVLDGQLIALRGDAPSWKGVRRRMSCSFARVRSLAAEFPAEFIASDLLVDAGASLVTLPFADRRRHLESFLGGALGRRPGLSLSPLTASVAQTQDWLDADSSPCAGVVARRVDSPYPPGGRHASVEVHRLRTANCVVGGIRYSTAGYGIDSLLLGLYDSSGLLHYVGSTRVFSTEHRRRLPWNVERLRDGVGFTGRRPVAIARWNPLAPELVAEVQYERFTAEVLRRQTRVIRWRPEEDPLACTFAQVGEDT